MRHASPLLRQPAPRGDRRGAIRPSLQSVSIAIAGCDACPRLRAHCASVAVAKKRAHAADTYWARPVPGFGDSGARLLLVGLAPAAHGANRTGRVFTGDGPNGSSDFLMAALHRAGLANQPHSRSADDGLELNDVYIAMALRCAPPGNTPTPGELARCLPHLDMEAACLPNLRVVVALGRVAFDAWLRVSRRRGLVLSPTPTFEHDHVVRTGDAAPLLIGCYHPSRQNTNTGRLTPAMLDDVLRRARALSRVAPGSPTPDATGAR